MKRQDDCWLWREEQEGTLQLERLEDCRLREEKEGAPMELERLKDCRLRLRHDRGIPLGVTSQTLTLTLEHPTLKGKGTETYKGCQGYDKYI